MAHRLCFPCWLLLCWLLVTVAEGQQAAVTLPGGSQNNVDPTDCRIFTLTPPPTTRSPATRVQSITRTPRCPIRFFPPKLPRIPVRLPNRPFFPPRCNHRFQFHPFFGPQRYFSRRYGYISRRNFQSASSSEES
ncbi:odontogenesis associated phosphoprotein [Erinaceus europaeus]|uniref:Odontogenesis associated phosphoprotein n=1 Tax=Erinaceus europaeus TaxID=9365 RepID=A0A1S2ZIK7_ERIEU|nr:odontogenesis associated phosphoprotein [Erinaceus europaeus]